MDTKKTIIALVVIGIVLWMFWITSANNTITDTLERGLGLDDVSFVVSDSGRVPLGVQPVSLTGHPQLGNYLTDATGRTLYMTTRASCAGECLSNWPPYVASKAVAEGAGALGAVQNKDANALQYTWNGKLLYYYAQDKKPGDVFGNGVGGVWSLVQE